jgi:anthranilate synthase/aminodeoxychorismate synthase-like glutamine amidotransferase
MKLLVVDNHDSFTFNLAQIIKQSGFCTFEVIKNDLIKLDDVDNFDKIIFTPGPGLPSDFPIMFEIIDRYKISKSILGVCLGHQAIANYFGAGLANSEKIVHGISKKVMVLENDVLFNSIPGAFEAGLYHSWYVSRDNFPGSLRITSASDDGIIMSVAHKTYNIRGVQFHPESIMTKVGKQIIFNWLKS